MDSGMDSDEPSVDTGGLVVVAAAVDLSPDFAACFLPLDYLFPGI